MSTSFSRLSVRGPCIKIKFLEVEDKIGMFYKPNEMKEADRSSACEAIVLEISPQAYQIFGIDEEKGKPWCKPGDHILVKKFGAIKQQNCLDEEDSHIRVILGEDVVGVFKNE